MSDLAESIFDPHAPTANTGATQLVPASLPEGSVQTETAEEDSEALFDVGAASFPAMLLEAVFEPDERERITATDQLPWRVNASLRITARDGSRWIGTGWFVSPRTLITAGHCVYINGSGDPNRDGWVRSIEIMPGRDEGNLPFGFATATTFRSVRGWTERGSQRHDYGAIILDSPLGDRTGTIGYASHPDGRLTGVIAHVVGYPGDKPSGTMWHHALPIARVDADQVFYAIDTAGGESGAAVYLEEDGLPVAVAIHAYGGGPSNSGTRITPEVSRNLQQWSA